MVFKTPLQWPQGYPRTVARKDALFSKKSSATGRVTSLSIHEATKRLNEELARHGVQNFDEDVIVSSDLKVTIGGQPRSDQAEPKDPGISVYWEVNGKSRNMAIDIYTRAADNIAAIAATLDAMRAIERHGGKAVQDKAFAGFDALPAPDSCWVILGLENHHRDKLITKDKVVTAFKMMAGQAHDIRGMPIDMGALVKARDEALAQIRGE